MLPLNFGTERTGYYRKPHMQLKPKRYSCNSICMTCYKRRAVNGDKRLERETSINPDTLPMSASQVDASPLIIFLVTSLSAFLHEQWQLSPAQEQCHRCGYGY